MIPTPTTITDFFRLPAAKIGAAQLTGPAHAANETLRELVGASVMDLADAETLNTAALSQARFEILKMAGNYLAMFHAAPAIATRFRTDGVTITETSETARTLRYATPEEIEQLRDQMWSAAMRTLASVGGLLLADESAASAYAAGQRTFTNTLPEPVSVTL